MTKQPVESAEISETSDRDFASQIAERRRAAEMSPAELTSRVRAYGIDFRQEHVAQLESGSRPVTLDEALVLAEVLGLSLPGPAQVRAGLQGDSWAQEVEAIEAELGQLSERLGMIQLAAVRLLARSLSLRTGYLDETTGSANRPDKQLVASLTSLVDRLATMKNTVGGLRAEVDG